MRNKQTEEQMSISRSFTASTKNDETHSDSEEWGEAPTEGEWFKKKENGHFVKTAGPQTSEKLSN